jgi:hypothetical protein
VPRAAEAQGMGVLKKSKCLSANEIVHMSSRMQEQIGICLSECCFSLVISVALQARKVECQELITLFGKVLNSCKRM